MQSAHLVGVLSFLVADQTSTSSSPECKQFAAGSRRIHGDVAAGGGYFCEALMADVDAAIAHLGQVTIFGRGLGAYVGLLAAGGRAEEVRGVILADGPGLAGGGANGHGGRRGFDDGRPQVTYGGWPLYYYVGDSEPGEISGHGRESFDGVWYLVAPAGDPIKTNVSSY